MASRQNSNERAKWIRVLLVALQISLVVILLVLWFTIDPLRESKNLWVLFFYSFPAEFLIAIVPHEPLLIYFGEFHTPLSVALAAICGTLLTEALNYSVFHFFSNLKQFEKIFTSRAVTNTVALFDKRPFTALVVAGVTPIPFFPFRFLVVLARYPLAKYLLAILTARTPRFFVLALIGHTFKIPDYILAVLFGILVIGVYFPFLRKITIKLNK